jgi:hypothetical protein
MHRSRRPFGPRCPRTPGQPCVPWRSLAPLASARTKSAVALAAPAAAASTGARALATGAGGGADTGHGLKPADDAGNTATGHDSAIRRMAAVDAWAEAAATASGAARSADTRCTFQSAAFARTESAVSVAAAATAVSASTSARTPGAWADAASGHDAKPADAGNLATGHDSAIRRMAAVDAWAEAAATAAGPVRSAMSVRSAARSRVAAARCTVLSAEPARFGVAEATANVATFPRSAAAEAILVGADDGPSALTFTSQISASCATSWLYGVTGRTASAASSTWPPRTANAANLAQRRRGT